MSLLLCGFGKHGVWLIDGYGLKAWRDGDDEKGNMKSISLDHFEEYGIPCGPHDSWVLPADYFERRAR